MACGLLAALPKAVVIDPTASVINITERGKAGAQADALIACSLQALATNI
jgi:hypothetical protein